LHVEVKVHGMAETGAGHAVPMYGMHAPVVRLVPQNWQDGPLLVAQLEHGEPRALQVAAELVMLHASEFFQKTFGYAQAAGSYCELLETHVPGAEGEAAQ
jgi:hypothetical protein